MSLEGQAVWIRLNCSSVHLRENLWCNSVLFLLSNLRRTCLLHSVSSAFFLLLLLEHFFLLLNFWLKFLKSHNAFMQVSNTPLSQTLQMQISLFSSTITTGSSEQVMNQKYQKWLVLFMIKQKFPYTENYLCPILILIKVCFMLEYQMRQCYYIYFGRLKNNCSKQFKEYYQTLEKSCYEIYFVRNSFRDWLVCPGWLHVN